MCCIAATGAEEVEAIKLNFQEQEISKTAYEFQKSFESKKNIIVGIY